MYRSTLFFFTCLIIFVTTIAQLTDVTLAVDEKAKGTATTGFPKVTEIIVEEEVELVRQCRCSEKDECVEKLQEYTEACNGQCADLLKKIGDPEKLKKCIVQQRSFGETLSQCIQAKTGKPCYDGEGEAPRIPKVDVRQSIDQELNKTVKLGKFLGNNPLLTGLSDALEAMREYSSCMNGCIGDKRKNGDCFAASGCQLKKPSADELKAAAFQCVTAEDRGQIAETCTCITEAGVTALTPICQILRLFAEKTEGFRTLLSASRQN